MTVLINTTTASYTHTLTVTGRLEGLYQCSVSNSKPSMAVSELRVQGIIYSYYKSKIMIFVCRTGMPESDVKLSLHISSLESTVVADYSQTARSEVIFYTKLLHEVWEKSIYQLKCILYTA